MTQSRPEISETCEEASPLSVKTYIACGVKATRRILSERGRKTYSMCDPCASHNVRNRGCEDVGSIEDAMRNPERRNDGKTQ